MKEIKGGVTAPQGFRANGVHAGVKAGSDPAKTIWPLIFSEKECTAAATHTLNRVKAAPLYVTMGHLEDGTARRHCQLGQCQCLRPYSHEYAERTCASAAEVTGLNKNDFVVASTGVIGQTLNVAVIEAALPQAGGRSGQQRCRFRRRRHRHYDHRYPQEGAGRAGGDRRQDRPDGRHRQGLGYDSPQHGHHAVLPHHRLRHYP